MTLKLKMFKYGFMYIDQKLGTQTVSFLEVILGHWRSLKVIRSSNTGLVAATVLPGFLALVLYA